MLLTLVGLIYRVLWISKGPQYYNYALLVMLGLSLHYAIGAFLGRGKSEDIAKVMLEVESGKRIIVGTVSIQKASPRERKE